MWCRLPETVRSNTKSKQQEATQKSPKLAFCRHDNTCTSNYRGKNNNNNNNNKKFNYI